MTDYFALLEQPQRPWLDRDALKEIFHEKTLQLHPDAQHGANDSAAFAELNEAYRTLRDPKLRLKHLLELHGAGNGGANGIPQQLQELFPAVSSVISQATAVTQKVTASGNALTRSLLQAELLRARLEVDRVAETMSRLEQSALDDLRTLDHTWDAASADAMQTARELHAILTYVSRWSGQLEELRFQLSGS